VAHVDDADPMLGGPGQDGPDVSPVEGEEVTDARALERKGNELSRVGGVHLVDCNGQSWSRPQARRPAFQAAGAKARVARGGWHLSMPDDDRRVPQRRHQRPQGARPSGTSDAPDMAGTVH